MNNNNFLIIKNMKLFINSLDDMVSVIPNRDRVLKDRIYNTSYDILYYLYLTNSSNNKKEYGNIILSNISMLDFYLERCLKNKYITSKVCEMKCKELLRIIKMIYGSKKNGS